MKKKEKANKFTQGKNPLTKNSKQKKKCIDVRKKKYSYEILNLKKDYKFQTCKYSKR